MNNKKGFNLGYFGFMILLLLAFNGGAIITFLLRFNMLNQKPYDPIRVKWSEEVGDIYADQNAADEGILYDLYVPKNIDTSKEQTLVMYIHGSNFSSGDKSDGALICKYLASKGYVCASVNYSLITQENDKTITTAVEELYRTAGAVNSRCGELGIKFKNMAVSGVYGGGTLALLYAYMEPEKSPVPVELVFEQTGPTSFNPDDWGYSGEEAVQLVNLMTKSSFTVDDIGSDAYIKAYKDISPETYIGNSKVPAILAYGTKDKIVPISMALKYSGSLRNSGVDVTFLEYTKSGHTMALNADTNMEYYDTIDRYLEAIVVQ